MSMERVSSNISPFSRWKYDVFLSFRGEDTRKKFIDHLYTALSDRGINVFRDDKELDRGEAISPGLFKAIAESKFSIIVFSRNYAYSSWCLDELAEIIQHKNTSKHIVFPIFYEVEPTTVRKQKGEFQKAFAEHEVAFRDKVEKVQKWRDALKEVANISGWEFKDRHEAEFIQEIVKEISRKLRPTRVGTFDNLVGLNSRLEKLKTKIRGRESNDVRMIGIWGMGGIGKTTIARAVYDTIFDDFEGNSFLANVRETSEKYGVTVLQKQLLSETLKGTEIEIYNDLDGMKMVKSKLQCRKVLVVLDDVANVRQLDKLAGSHFWFGSGSRIIITTRDEHLIRDIVDDVYDALELNHAEAFQLFSMKAFNNNQPSEEYVELINHVIEYADGLPLALDILGSFLRGRPMEEWLGTLERLNSDSENEILDKLQISFDGLKESEKKIFLDIACFFKGQDRDYITKILDYCGFNPVIGISVLIEKSLITINRNKLWMHDLLEEMGQNIVTRHSPGEPGKCSRLWRKEDLSHVLTENSGTERVEGILLEFPGDEVPLTASSKAFSKMTNLRLLKICNMQLPEGLEYLSKELRFLDWKGYPLKSLPTNSHLNKVIELNMCYSRIEQMWKGVKPLNKLKHLRLSHSQNLIRTPNLTGVPNLEELILERCTRLREIHPSLLVHKKLVLLNLRDCTSLATLPSEISMESLKKLVLSGCSKLKKFPEVVGKMECLLELHLDATALVELPLSIELLTGLCLLTLKNCTNLLRLPSSINGLTSLKTLNLSGCFNFENDSDSLGQEESFEELDVSGTAIRNPVSSNFLMKNLKSLIFGGCEEQPSSTSGHSTFPINLMRRSLDAMSLKLPSFPGLNFLTKLNLRGYNVGEGVIPDDICNLFSLEELDLSKNSFVSLPRTISHFLKLEHLKLEDCKRLKSLPELPSSIAKVGLDGCDSLETLSDAFKLCTSKVLFIECRNCSKFFCHNALAFSVLKEFLEVESITRRRFDIVVPGSEIPEWFSYQNQGSSIKLINPPPDLYNNKKLVGYAACCVFQIHTNQAIKKHLDTYKLYFRVLTYKSTYLRKVGYTNFKAQSGRAVSDHLCLTYFPLESICGESFIEFSFTTNWVPGLKVKMCGVHPVYMHQEEEFIETKNQWSRSTVCNLNEFHHNFVGSTAMDAATTSKRNLIGHVGADSEASGSGCCDD